MSTPSLTRRLLTALSSRAYAKEVGDAAMQLLEATPTQQIGFYSDPNFGVGIIDSDPMKRQEVQQQAYVLWQTNPLGGAIINWTTMFVLGEGVAISHADKAVHTFIQDWWDWQNMDELQTQWCDELAVFGELYLEKIVNDAGRLSIVSIDPRTIHAIETDPNDVRKVVSYYQKFNRTTYGANNSSRSEEQVRTIPAENILHWKVNAASFAKFGSSDLLRVLAPIPMYSRWLADRARVNWMKNNYFIDVTVQGGGVQAAKVAERIRARGKHMSPGSVNVHGDNETWEIKQPVINGADAAEDGRAIKLYIAAGANLPEYLLGDASNGNMASTKSQETPLVKKFKKRQKSLARLFRTIFSEVVRAGIAAKSVPATFENEQTDGTTVTTPSDTASEFTVDFPQVVEADVKAAVDAFLPLFTSGLISGRSLVTRVGMDYDEEQALRRKEEEAEDNLEQQDPQDAAEDDADDAAGATPPPAVA